jgi:hypothetical protein
VQRAPRALATLVPEANGPTTTPLSLDPAALPHFPSDETSLRDDERSSGSGQRAANAAFVTDLGAQVAEPAAAIGTAVTA